MDDGRKYVYRQLFENTLLKSMGDAFQQIFYNLMEELYDNFEKIEIQGAIGDRKNDGYLRGDGVFFQAYGPKDYEMNASSLKEAIGKMPGDFLLLKNHVDCGKWEEIKEYIFVFKTHRGSYPDLIEVINTLEKDYAPIKFKIYDIKQLLKLFSKLTIEQMNSVTNTYIPEVDFSELKYDVMGEIVLHLINGGNSNNIDVTKKVPDFNDKIQFNKICSFYASNLIAASYRIDELDDFLSSYENINISDILCSIFKDLYKKAIEEYPDDTTLQFKYILDNCHKDNLSNLAIQQYETNSYVMMAKYFETCDIFEEPPKKSSD